MIGRFTILDVLFILYFFFLFPLLHEGWRWLGILFGLLLIIRIIKDTLPPDDKIFFESRSDENEIFAQEDPTEQPPPPV